MPFIIKHKDLILYRAWADLRSEARRYYLSYIWWVLEPILEMMIFYLVFAVLLQRGGPDFVQFLLIGLVVWKWFGTTLQHCGDSIIKGKNLMQQIKLPKLFFPTVIIVTDTFKAAISMIVVVSFLLYSGFFPDLTWLALPVLLLVQLLLITALGYLLAAITPYFPDLSIIISLLLRAMFFLSGIFYDPQRIPEMYRDLFFMNPVARLIDDYRGILMHQRYPQLEPLLIIALVSILVIILVSRCVGRHETEYPRIVV